MNINISEQDQITVIELDGAIDGKTAPEIQEQVLPLIQPGSHILLDMRRVNYMSSAGLRLLLLLYRQINGGDGRVVLVGVSERLQDTMAITGFINFFDICDTFDSGMKALKN